MSDEQLLPEELATTLAAEREARLRLAADFANFRRRVANEREAADRSAVEALIGRLLTLADFIDLAIEASPPEIAASGHGEGLRSLQRELAGILASQGVEPAEALGLPFDPTLHEASGTLARDGYTPGTVTKVHRRGYTRVGRPLRPALVSVAPEEQTTRPAASSDESSA
jgi:molecular chaperone GrpE